MVCDGWKTETRMNVLPLPQHIPATHFPLFLELQSFCSTHSSVLMIVFSVVMLETSYVLWIHSP